MYYKLEIELRQGGKKMMLMFLNLMIYNVGHIEFVK